jgi:zinc/manganese transport system substrate-binding protein
MIMTRFLLLLTLMVAGPASALNIVATSPSMGALVRTIAPDAELVVLAGPDRDMHRLQAKPSMIRALRSADLVVAVGAELEVGWLPAAIASAANRDIQPGQTGYFEAAAQVPLLEEGGTADRALGDVHPAGNPHVDMDPVRMASIGGALADRLVLLDSTNARTYRANAAAFRDQVDQRMSQWQQQAAAAPGVVLYHRDAVYLLDRFDVPLLGTIEAIPGVPPSGRHLKELGSELAGRKGVIIYAPYHPPKGPRRLAERLNWSAVVLPIAPPVDADGNGYLRHIDRWVETIAGAG